MALDNASAEAMPQSYIGSRICLISKSEIRYEGILYTIDMKESTIALQHGALQILYFSSNEASILSDADSLLIGLVWGIQSGLMVLKGGRKTGLKSLQAQKLLSTLSFEVSMAFAGSGSVYLDCGVHSRKSTFALDFLRVAAI